MATRRSPKSSGPFYVVRSAEHMSFVGQCPFNGGSDWVWVSTHETEKEARGVAALESLGSGVECLAVKADSYTGRISLARFKGQLQSKDLSLNARDLPFHVKHKPRRRKVPGLMALEASDFGKVK